MGKGFDSKCNFIPPTILLGLSFALVRGLSFFGRIQHFPLNVHIYIYEIYVSGLVIFFFIVIHEKEAKCTKRILIREIILGKIKRVRNTIYFSHHWPSRWY